MQPESNLNETPGERLVEPMLMRLAGKPLLVQLCQVEEKLVFILVFILDDIISAKDAIEKGHSTLAHETLTRALGRVS